ncbi:hypothetical protein [Mycobacterium sp. DBP42]|uniref:hypothetical protein n=1 Tax=Mycobacterium sp. DBP42 TaxID=2545267 RepID=UPI0010423B08|nr:hypothetical protein [Mycobacterium sp. DBP42]TMS50383.1 hypothetical protein E0T84_24020 [Mycobacterium sp. DBP42]
MAQALRPKVVFHLRRIARLTTSYPRLRSEAAMEARLDELANLVRRRLHVSGDSQIREEEAPDHPFTTFVEGQHGQEFSVG